MQLFFYKKFEEIKKKRYICVLNVLQKKGIPTPTPGESFNPEKISLEKIISAMTEKRSCKVCGRSLDDIKRYRAVGCPACYSNFSQEIKEIFAGNGELKTYCGTFPKHVSDGRSSLQDRAILQEKLAESVAREDFEKAAIYRDKIKELDKKDE